MTAKIIDGRAVAGRLKAELTAQTARLTAEGRQPGLAVVIVGDNPASRVYVNMKQKACAEIGIYSEEHALDGGVSQSDLLRLIEVLNADPKIHGILVQLPLPRHLDEQAVIEKIDPAKDVDGFHPVNVGKLAIGIPGFVSCTPAGVMALIKESGVAIAGKECVVVGRSNIVGKPMALLLLRENATITICHTKTEDLAAKCKDAEILVAAIGQDRFFTKEMVRPGAVVIDVGINRGEDGKLHGDVDEASLE